MHRWPLIMIILLAKKKHFDNAVSKCMLLSFYTETFVERVLTELFRPLFLKSLSSFDQQESKHDDSKAHSERQGIWQRSHSLPVMGCSTSQLPFTSQRHTFFARVSHQLKEKWERERGRRQEREWIRKSINELIGWEAWAKINFLLGFCLEE